MARSGAVRNMKSISPSLPRLASVSVWLSLSKRATSEMEALVVSPDGEAVSATAAPAGERNWKRSTELGETATAAGWPSVTTSVELDERMGSSTKEEGRCCERGAPMETLFIAPGTSGSDSGSVDEAVRLVYGEYSLPSRTTSRRPCSTVMASTALAASEGTSTLYSEAVPGAACPRRGVRSCSSWTERAVLAVMANSDWPPETTTVKRTLAHEGVHASMRTGLAASPVSDTLPSARA
mmetsp:Transcript_27448/g.57800  ORF Transcript_27448/g.57800 Transcript_27448/m.57800 type:complete len:238 (-) Transcript_27448:783-1496(-)